MTKFTYEQALKICLLFSLSTSVFLGLIWTSVRLEIGGASDFHVAYQLH
jgi:hypothetical protein